MSTTGNHNTIPDGPEEFSPQFSRAGSANPFKAGDDYFEQFAAKIGYRVEEFEALRTEAPNLSNIPKYNPFAVPAGYFDELPGHVQQRVIIEKQRRPSLAEWLQLAVRPRFVFPVMTVMLLAFAGLRYVNRESASTEKTAFAEEVSLEDQLQLQNIDEATIVDALASQDPAKTSSDSENDRIVDYLMDNNVNVDDSNF